jgi:purine-binding chemotaxis protein CheW
VSHDQDGSRLVTFRIGDGLYAVDVARVERVLRYAAPRRVPTLPDWIEGLLDHDGRVLAVIDLRSRLGAAAMSLGDQTRLLLLDIEGDWCAMIVDEVLDVRVYDVDAVSPPPDLVRGLAGELFVATARRDGALVIVLDVPRLFSVAERQALTRMEVDATTHA